MKRFKTFMAVNGLGLLTDLLALAGMILIPVGAGLVYFPAGLIVGGVCCIAAAVVISRGAAAGGDGS